MRIPIHPSVPKDSAADMAKGLGLKLFDDGTTRFMWRPAVMQIIDKVIERNLANQWEIPDGAA